MNALYTAEALSTGHGREERVTTSDETCNVTLAPPRESGGLGGGKTINIENSTVDGRMRMGHNDVGGCKLAVELEVTSPDLPHEQAQELADAAHLVCRYSNAARVNIDVTLQVSND